MLSCAGNLGLWEPAKSLLGPQDPPRAVGVGPVLECAGARVHGGVGHSLHSPSLSGRVSLSRLDHLDLRGG